MRECRYGHGPQTDFDADAISPLAVEGEQDARAWHLRKISDRHEAADEGRFVSDADVRAVIRKFVPKE